MTTIFEQIIATKNVEDAYVETISTWADTYLSEVERQNNISVPTMGRPASYQKTYDTDNWPLAQMPGIVVVCPGTTGTLERQGDQTYGGWFDVGIAIVLSGQTESDARNTAQLYQAAINSAILQHGELGGFSTDTVLVTFSVKLQEVGNRYVALAISEFHSFIDGLVTASAGPILPDPTKLTPDPNGPSGSPEGIYSGYPEVSAVDVTLTEST